MQVQPLKYKKFSKMKKEDEKSTTLTLCKMIKATSITFLLNKTIQIAIDYILRRILKKGTL